MRRCDGATLRRLHFRFLVFSALFSLLSWHRNHPSGLMPSPNDVPCGGIGDVRLQREDVVGGEGVGQAVEYSAVLRVASCVVGIGGILLAEDVAKETALLLKDIFRHHQGKVDDVLRLFLTRQQAGHYATAHADNGGTTAVGIHHSVNALHGLLALVLDPLGDGLSEPWRVDESMLGAEGVHGFKDGLGVAVTAILEHGHRSEGRVGHLADDDTGRKSVLDVLALEALAQGSVGAEDGPVVAHADHAALSLVRVVVLAPLVVVEGEAVDVIFRRPRARAVGLAQCVELRAELVERVALRVLQSLQER